MEEMGVFRAALDPESKPTVYPVSSSATVELGGGEPPKEEEETMLALVASEVEDKTGLAPVGEGAEEGESVVVTEIETPRMVEPEEGEGGMEGVVELSV